MVERTTRRSVELPSTRRYRSHIARTGRPCTRPRMNAKWAALSLRALAGKESVVAAAPGSEAIGPLVPVLQNSVVEFGRHDLPVLSSFENATACPVVNAVAVKHVEVPGERHTQPAVDRLDASEELVRAPWRPRDFGDPANMGPGRNEAEPTLALRVDVVRRLEHPVIAD